MTPLNQYQIPDKSIMDIFGRQNYLGNDWTGPFNKSLTNTSEVPVALIKNPVNSGKSLFFYEKKVTSDSQNVYTRFYFDPTVTSTGSATTNVCHRPGYGTSSVALSYLSPTIASNGTFVSTLLATIYVISSEVLYIIDPGHSLLVTGQQQTAGTSNLFLNLNWYEI